MTGINESTSFLGHDFYGSGVLGLCALGSWQIQRLHLKENLIANLEKAAAAEPIALDSTDIQHAFENNVTILRGTLTGHYLHNHEINVGPRPQNDLMGHHIVTPFQLQDGGIVLVLRGWIQDGNQAPVQQPDGTLTISGVLKEPASTNSFTPKNIPEKNQWYHIDPAQIENVMNLRDVAPMVLYEQMPHSDSGWPLPIDAMAYPDNKHLSYAIFWFSMAGMLIVIYSLRFITAQKEKR